MIKNLNTARMIIALYNCIDMEKFRVVIFTKTHDTRKLILKNLINYFDRNELKNTISRDINNNVESFIEFKNGSELRVVSADGCGRGMRFCQVFYEDGIGKDILDCVVSPHECSPELYRLCRFNIEESKEL